MLPKADNIVINPVSLGEWVLDVQQIIPDSSQIKVMVCKKIRLLNGIVSSKKSFNERLHIVDSAQPS
jgi:hypothetical protein